MADYTTVAHAFMDRSYGTEQKFYTTGDVAVSYRQPIAVRVDDGTIYIRTTFYSMTTSRHRTALERAATGRGWERVDSIEEWDVYRLPAHLSQPAPPLPSRFLTS